MENKIKKKDKLKIFFYFKNKSIKSLTIFHQTRPTKAIKLAIIINIK